MHSFKTILLTLSLSVLSFSCVSSEVTDRQQKDNILGWDLSYQSLLKTNNIKQNEWLFEWINQPSKFVSSTEKRQDPFHSPIQQIITDWHDEQIVSSILIDYPAFHAGEHLTAWFVRTQNHLLFWFFMHGKIYHCEKMDIPPDGYDGEFDNIFSLNQLIPVKNIESGKSKNGQNLNGYIGFLSVYDKDASKQILLTLEDFYCVGEECKDNQPGRLAVLLDMINENVAQSLKKSN